MTACFFIGGTICRLNPLRFFAYECQGNSLTDSALRRHYVRKLKYDSLYVAAVIGCTSQL